ncbi:hypothetical protein B484DRAFT_406816 [Ochromonadaceae sp. CCMP2298]|nr:hypothetical protein B484DRAFT_406816 [Ochromonadaceae sp. CCMP2298]
MSGHHSDNVVQGYIDKGMTMKLLAAGATSVSGGVFGKGPSVPGFQHQASPRPPSHGHPMTSDADMPYWLKVNDKRVRRQGNENLAPVYSFNITVTGDVKAPLHLNAGQGSSSDL